jgi:hypothetical protein
LWRVVEVEQAASDAPEQDSERSRKPPRRRLSWADAIVAVALGLIAFRFRHHIPSDGLFFDDAWQAFAAVEGSFRNLLTVGQTQPGFGFELMVWTRLFGDSTASLVSPAMVAGSLGPPALYLVLRAFRFARSVSVLLSAAFTVSVTHIIYSGRVKAYTGEVLVVLLLAVLVPWLARRRWGIAMAMGWFIGSMALGSFSSFALLAATAAGATLVLHPRDDRWFRVGAVGAQAAGVLVLLSAEDRTHNAPLLNDYFENENAFFEFTLNPVSFVRELFGHFERIVAVFPGGPPWTQIVFVAIAGAGLILLAWKGTRAIAARFMLIMIVIAIGGALAGRIPFGPEQGAFRAVLWMTPVVAFGLAAVLERARRAIAERGERARIGFDVAAFALAVVLLLSAVGVRRSYPPASLAATRQVMASIGPDDAVLITRPTIYSFALNADTPVRLHATPELLQGIAPVFRDPRLHPVDFLTAAQRRKIAEALTPVDRVYVVHSRNDPNGYKKYLLQLALEIRQQGFEQTRSSNVKGSTITVWDRKAG